MNKKEEVIYFSLVASFLLMISIIPFGNADVYQNSSLTLSVDISVPTARVEISPNSIYFGQTTKGYYTNYTNITFTNKGTLDVNIIPILENDSDKIFNYLEFNTASCSLTSTSGWHNISYYDSANELFLLNKIDPTTLEEDKDFACLRLNLIKYNDSEIISPSSKSTQITFWVMSV
ncbi:Uncharacterised protein [uncultured archaeon]|nr:Uncharacterised protein [uncultured archaeon]